MVISSLRRSTSLDLETERSRVALRRSSRFVLLGAVLALSPLPVIAEVTPADVLSSAPADMVVAMHVDFAAAREAPSLREFYSEAVKRVAAQWPVASGALVQMSGKELPDLFLQVTLTFRKDVLAERALAVFTTVLSTEEADALLRRDGEGRASSARKYKGHTLYEQGPADAITAVRGAFALGSRSDLQRLVDSLRTKSRAKPGPRWKDALADVPTGAQLWAVLLVPALLPPKARPTAPTSATIGVTFNEGALFTAVFRCKDAARAVAVREQLQALLAASATSAPADLAAVASLLPRIVLAAESNVVRATVEVTEKEAAVLLGLALSTLPPVTAAPP